MLTFLYKIHENWNIYVEKRNYFAFIIHQANKHEVSRRWFIETDVKDFKSGALRTTTNITRTWFELSVMRSRNAIYVSIIVIPKKSILLFSRYKTLCKTQKNTWIPFILLGSCLLDKWCLVDCFHCEFRVSPQIMVLDYCIAKCKKFSGHFFLWFKIFALITTL